jgi:molybdopterin-guanine dinucleotide biosynthesis protein A
MGRDKALLPLPSGERLIDHMLGIARASGAGSLWVSGPYPELGGIADRLPGRGPLSGILAVLDRAAGAGLCGCLLVPVDMPGLRGDLLARLARSGGPAYFRDHPLPAFLPATREICERLHALLAGDPVEASVRAALTLAGARPIAWAREDAACFRNLNSPGDWEAYRDSAVR